MLKTLCLQFCLLSFVIQNGSKLYIIVSFAINQDYIAKNLCVNKDVPESCCQGKCHLEKELIADEKKEERKETPSYTRILTEDLYNKLIQTKYDFNTPFSIIDHLTPLETHHSYKHLKAVFHPPNSQNYIFSV